MSDVSQLLRSITDELLRLNEADALDPDGFLADTDLLLRIREELASLTVGRVRAPG
jgi:hypothetical protein